MSEKIELTLNCNYKGNRYGYYTNGLCNCNDQLEKISSEIEKLSKEKYRFNIKDIEGFSLLTCNSGYDFNAGSKYNCLVTMLNNFDGNGDLDKVMEKLCKGYDELRYNKYHGKYHKERLSAINAVLLNKTPVKESYITSTICYDSWRDISYFNKKNKREYHDSNFEIFDTLIAGGGVPTYHHLEEACTRRKYKIIERIIGLGIKPDQKLFEKLFYGVSIRGGKVKKSTDAKEVAELMDLFHKNGFKLTEDNIIYALEHGCCVPSLSFYGLEVTQKIQEKCDKLKFYPYIKEVKLTIENLNSACKVYNNFDNVLKIIKSGVEPNQTTLECAFLSNDKDIIDHLLKKYKFKLTDECLQNYLKMNNNYILKLFFNDKKNSIKFVANEEINEEINKEINEE